MGLFCSSSLAAQDLPLVRGVEFQPLAAAARRVVAAMEYVGSPIREVDRDRFEQALQGTDPARAVEEIQGILDAYCLVGVNINPKAGSSCRRGPRRNS